MTHLHSLAEDDSLHHLTTDTVGVGHSGTSLVSSPVPIRGFFVILLRIGLDVGVGEVGQGRVPEVEEWQDGEEESRQEAVQDRSVHPLGGS